MSATHFAAVPTAICAATTGSSGPVSSRWSASTAARLDLRSVAQVTSPPRTTAEAPGTSTSEATNRPPVRDSADASDSPSRVQVAMMRRLVSSSSGSATGSVPATVRLRLTVELRRLHAVVDAGDEGDDDGRRHHDPGEHEKDEVDDLGNDARQGEDEQEESDRHGLEHRLDLPAAGGGHDDDADHEEPQQGDAEFAHEDDHRHPPGQFGDDGQADEGRGHERFVGDGVGDLAEVRHEVVLAGQVAVDLVGEHGQEEDDERPPPRRDVIAPV